MYMYHVTFLQVEAELEASRSHLQKESARISSEMAQLRQDQVKVRAEGEAIAKERERLEKLAKEVEERSQQAERLHQVRIFFFYCCLIITGVYSFNCFVFILVCASHEGEGRVVTSRGTEFEGPVGDTLKVY